MQFIFLGIRLVTFPSQIYTQFSGRYLPDLPHHLEQPGTAGDAAPFQRWRNCEADRLIRPGLVGDHQIGRHRIKLPVGALRRGVEGLQANGDVGVRVQYSVRSLVKCFLIFYEEVLPDSEQILEMTQNPRIESGECIFVAKALPCLSHFGLFQSQPILLVLPHFSIRFHFYQAFAG